MNDVDKDIASTIASVHLFFPITTFRIQQQVTDLLYLAVLLYYFLHLQIGPFYKKVSILTPKRFMR